MGTDWQRNRDLDALLANNQYGFGASIVDSRASSGLQINGRQVVRWGGDRYDVNAWRVYLGPWRPKPGIEVDAFDQAIIADFAGPVPPEMNPSTEIALRNNLTVWAQVKWGTGSVRHVAYVDWPVAGLLLQVSASYVEVNAYAVLTDLAQRLDEEAATRLPDISGSLSDEPGGGDSARSATFTYPFQALDWSVIDPDPVTGNVGINFVVPPFARSVYFEWDNTKDNANAGYATEAIIRFRRPDSQLDEGVYTYHWTAGDIGDPREGIPVPPSCAYVRVEFIFPVGPPPVAGVGASFELDL